MIILAQVLKSHLHLTLSVWFCVGAIAALVGSSRLVEGESGGVSAALFESVASASTVTVVFALKAALDCMQLLVPGVFVQRQFFGERFIALADVVATRVDFVGALNRLVSVFILQEVHSVSDVLAAALSVVFVLQTFVAVFEFETSAIDRIQWLSVTARRDVVRAFWQTVTSVVAVAAEFLFFLQPKDIDFQLAEFAQLDFIGNAVDSHETHNRRFEFISFAP